MKAVSKKFIQQKTTRMGVFYRFCSWTLYRTFQNTPNR